jgi:ComF family protein
VRDLADLILPRVCPVCRENLSGVEREICLDCLSSLPYTYFWSYKNNPAEELFWGKVYFQRASSLFFYGDDSPYRHLVHELKYNGRSGIGTLLGSMLGRRLKDSGYYNDIDFVVSVPVHPFKYWMRGYNQATIIAKAVAGELNVNVIKGALSKRAFASSQTKMDPENRWKNAVESFSLASASKVEGKHILLIDDVLTTGATLEACGSALLCADGCRVSVATLAFVE